MPLDSPSDSPVTTPTPVKKHGFMVYIMENIPNHLKVLAFLVIVVIVVFGWNYVKDLRAELESQKKTTATLAQQFQAVGITGVAESGNSKATAREVGTQTSDAFGAAVVNLMRQQNARIDALTTAVGTVKATVSVAAPQPTVFSSDTHNVATGNLNGYVLEEARPDAAPPLDSVSLFYKPMATDPAKAFAGTTWNHYQEQFTTSLGSWEKSKTGGLSTTVKLTRTVSKPDLFDPTKMDVIGTEDIPITGANTVYSPSGLVDAASVGFPRWTLGLGLSSTNLPSPLNNTASVHLKPVATIDYRVFKRFGVFVGAANGGAVGGISFHFGAPK